MDDKPFSRKTLLAIAAVFVVFLIAVFAVFGGNILNGVLLGIVQGISEWLPISSKTQIIIASTYLLHLTFDQSYTFGLFMEIGTIFAAIIYFRKELKSLVLALVGRGNLDSWLLLKYVVVSTVVTGIIGAPLYLVVDSLSGTYNIGIPIMLLGIVLIIDAFIIRYSRQKYNTVSNRRSLKDLGFRDYIFVGIAQGLAALPGVSRSGFTTSTLLLSNTDAHEAFRLSFIDMVFATAAAIALSVLADKSAVVQAVSAVSVTGLVVSIIVATLISLLMIDFLLKEAKKSSIVYLTAALGIIAIFGGILALVFGVAA